MKTVVSLLPMGPRNSPKKAQTTWKLAGGFKGFWNVHPETWGNDFAFDPI